LEESNALYIEHRKEEKTEKKIIEIIGVTSNSEICNSPISRPTNVYDSI
jgi:hypothetical protein